VAAEGTGGGVHVDELLAVLAVYTVALPADHDQNPERTQEDSKNESQEPLAFFRPDRGGNEPTDQPDEDEEFHLYRVALATSQDIDCTCDPLGKLPSDIFFVPGRNGGSPMIIE